MAPHRIDTHHHPYTPTYIAKTGDVLRHTTHAFYDRLTKWHPDQAIAAMDKSGIAVSVLSISTPSVWLGSAPPPCEKIHRMFGQRWKVPPNSRLVIARVVSNGNSMVGGGMLGMTLNAKLAAVGWK